MSVGTATIRAHARDDLLTANIFAVCDAEWRTPIEWYVVATASGTFPRAAQPTPADVGHLLRRLVAEGDMERRVNPADARSRQFRLVP